MSAWRICGGLPTANPPYSVKQPILSGIKKSPQGKVQAEISLEHHDDGGLLARIRLTAFLFKFTLTPFITGWRESAIQLYFDVAFFFIR
jgi:hypothetical protein